jgi:hypothetical protein
LEADDEESKTITSELKKASTNAIKIAVLMELLIANQDEILLQIGYSAQNKSNNILENVRSIQVGNY